MFGSGLYAQSAWGERPWFGQTTAVSGTVAAGGEATITAGALRPGKAGAGGAGAIEGAVLRLRSGRSLLTGQTGMAAWAGVRERLHSLAFGGGLSRGRTGLIAGVASTGGGLGLGHALSGRVVGVAGSAGAVGAEAGSLRNYRSLVASVLVATGYDRLVGQALGTLLASVSGVTQMAGVSQAWLVSGELRPAGVGVAIGRLLGGEYRLLSLPLHAAGIRRVELSSR